MGMGHTFIIIGDDIYCLDTAEERLWAAMTMQNGGIERAQVYRGMPDGKETPDGREFGADGLFHKAKRPA